MHVEKQVFGAKMECSDEVGLEWPLYIHASSRKCGRESSRVRARNADLEAILEKVPWEHVGQTIDKPRTKAEDVPREQRLVGGDRPVSRKPGAGGSNQKMWGGGRGQGMLGEGS